MQSQSKLSVRRLSLACALALPSSMILAACAPKIVSTPPAACASLLPTSWRSGVAPEGIPDTSGMSDLDAAKSWAQAYVGQSGRLEIANGRTADAIGIVERCEELQNKARD